MSILIDHEDPKTRLWTAEEFYDLSNDGYFQDHRVELIEGEIVQMSPQGNFHALSIEFAAEILRKVFGPSFWVRVQATIDLSPNTVVDPDIAVVEGNARKQHRHPQNPTTAVLVVEASESTLRFDRTVKCSLYAKAGIEDYWIINIKNRQLEVHRQPQADPSQPFGFGYADIQILDPQSTVSPLAQPNATIAVADLLP